MALSLASLAALWASALDPGLVFDRKLDDRRGIGDSTASFSTGGTRSGQPPTPPVIWPTIEWPYFWDYRMPDPDDGLDPSVDILVAYTNNYYASHMYIRILVEASSPDIRNHTWWLYLDNGDGDNDWLIEEKSGSWELCSYAWNTGNGRWGVGGTRCDLSDSMRDTDLDGAVRVMTNCVGTNGCVDFALLKSHYSAIGWNPKFTGATDVVEDLNLLGNTTRSPASAPGGCSVPTFDDCTTPTIVQLPEFSDVLTPVAIVTAIVLFSGRRARRAR